MIPLILSSSDMITGILLVCFAQNECPLFIDLVDFLVPKTVVLVPEPDLYYNVMVARIIGTP